MSSIWKLTEQFCGEFHLLRDYRFSKLFYGCGWILKACEGTEFTLEYEAYEPPFKEVGKHEFVGTHLEHARNVHVGYV
jgi:hypothetical protein